MRDISLFLLLLLALMVGSISAGTNIDTLYDFKRAVRMEMAVADNHALPDSALTQICQRAILWTSTDCGGVEKMFRVVTVADQSLYSMPDSVVEVLYGTILSVGLTKSIKAYYPQFAEDVFGDQLGTPGAEKSDLTPPAFNYWQDTLQLIPTPIQEDTVIFKAYVEHQKLTANGDSILLKPPYIEAAIAYACHLAYKRLQQYDIAKLYKDDYKALCTDLRNRYARKMDVLAK